MILFQFTLRILSTLSWWHLHLMTLLIRKTLYPSVRVSLHQLWVKYLDLLTLFIASVSPDSIAMETHCKLWLLQFYALFVKRLQYTRGKAVTVMLRNLFPLMVIAFGLLVSHILKAVPDQPPLILSPHLFFAYSQYNYLFAGGYYTNQTASMIDSLFHPCGVADLGIVSDINVMSRCYSNRSESFQCPSSDYPQQQYSCSCSTCDSASAFTVNQSSVIRRKPPSCYNGTGSGSRVQNLAIPFRSSSPDAAYLTLQEYLMRSRDAFIEQRYGGVSFGHYKQDVPARVDKLNSDPNSSLFLSTYSAAKVWYSLKGYHSMPAYLNTMNNAILRGHLSSQQSEQQPMYGE